MNLIRDARLVTCRSLLTLLVGTSASAQQPPQPVVARLVAEPASVTVQVGDSLPFRVIAYDSAGRVLTNATIRVGGPRRAVFFGDGFVRGFQWLDGSFAENVEAHEQRSPRDVDLVTFAYTPIGMSSTQTSQLLVAHPDLFVPAKAKEKYGCDPYVVPLDKSPESLVKRTTYYFGLFSHRRSDQVWKGLLQIPLESDDALARALLQNLPLGDSNAVAA